MLTLTEPQSRFFQSEAKAVAMVSGFGAGKTMGAVARLIATKHMYPKVDLLYCAPTYSLVRDILYVEMEMTCTAMSIPFTINRGDNFVAFPGAGKILCRTMDRPEKLIGFNIGDVVLDELDTLPADKAMEVWYKVMARMRMPFPDGKPNQIYVPTTPEGFKAVYNLFKKNKPDNYELIKASTMSNPHLPPDYVQSLKDIYPAQLIEAYINGEFVNLTSGACYYAFDRELCDTHYVPRPRETLHIGMDFNVYKMAAIVHIMRDGVLHAVDEFIDLRDTPDMILAIKEAYKGHPIYIYPDSTGDNKSSKGSTLSDHSLLKAAKFRVKARSRNPFVKDRLIAMNAGFEHSKYKVNVRRCTTYVECLEQQVFDKNGQPDKTTDLDHAPDAGGYCVNYLMPVVRQRVLNRKLGGL